MTQKRNLDGLWALLTRAHEASSSPVAVEFVLETVREEKDWKELRDWLFAQLERSETELKAVWERELQLKAEPVEGMLSQLLGEGIRLVAWREGAIVPLGEKLQQLEAALQQRAEEIAEAELRAGIDTVVASVRQALYGIAGRTREIMCGIDTVEAAKEDDSLPACGSCGHRYDMLAQEFCPVCGSPRMLMFE